MLLLFFSILCPIQFYAYEENQSADFDSIKYYTTNNEYVKALKYAIKKSDYLLQNKRYEEYCDVVLQKSELYEQFNDIENALNVLHKAKNIAEKNNLKVYEIEFYKKISDLNTKIFEYTKAKKYLKTALSKAMILQDKDLLVKVYRSYFKISSETKSDKQYREKEKFIDQKQERNQKLLLIFASLFILAGFIFYFMLVRLVTYNSFH